MVLNEERRCVESETQATGGAPWQPIILSRFSPEAFRDPKESKKLAEAVPNKIRSECSGVAWKDSLATLGRFDVADIVEADAPKQRQTSCDYLRLRTFDEAKRRLRRHGRNFEEALARYQGCDPHWQGPVEPMRNSILEEAKSTPRSAKLQPQTLPLRLGKTVNGLCKSRAGWAEIFLACPAAVVQNRQSKANSG